MAKTTTQKKQRSASKQQPFEGKAPNRGQWKAKNSNEITEPVGFQMVSVKMRPAEAEEFKARCDELGVTRNYALRVMARDVCGFLEVDAAALRDFNSITRQITGIATNINQIAKAGNRTFNPDYQAFMEDRKKLGAELRRLEQKVQIILNVGKRRSDGLEKLKESIDVS